MKRRLPLYAVLIVFGLVLSLLIGAYSNLMRYRFGILDTEDESIAWKATVAAASTYDAALMVRNSVEAAFDSAPIRPVSPLEDVLLRLEPGAIKQMAQSLPESAKSRYYSGKMLYPDGKWRGIKFRLRGRNIWHWHPDKPSLRIKLKRSRQLDLQRHINLVNPEDPTMVANLFGERLAQQLGVLTHKTEMVRVFINNAYFGVYQKTTREDENMLRVNKRIPGPFYVGDNLRSRWASDQFKLAGELDVLDWIDPMSPVTDAMYDAPEPARYAKLWKYLDKDKLARWFAVTNLSGGIHTDYKHNHTYYFDPSTGKLEPVITDILALGTLLYPGARARLSNSYVPAFDLPLNERLQPLIDVALRDPYFYFLRNQILYDAINGPLSTEKQQKLLRGILEQIEPDVRADRRKAFVMETFSGFFRMPYSNRQFKNATDEAYKWIRNRNQFLSEQLEKSEVSIDLSTDPNSGVVALVAVKGHSAAKFDLSGFRDNIMIDRNRDGLFETPVSGELILYPGLIEDKEFRYEVVKDRRIPDHFLMPGVQRYLIRIGGLDVATVRLRLAQAFSNAVTGRMLTPKVVIQDAIDTKSVQYSVVSLHAWSFPVAETGTIKLGPGVVELRETLFIGSRQGLEIMPGTTLRMGPGVSIFSEGKVLVGALDEAGVRIERLDPDAPWGVFAVVGKKATGSAVRNTKVVGGSQAELRNMRFSGMMSFRWVPNVEISNAELGSNVVGDDTLHFINSTVRIQDLLLNNCFADCIDFDYTNGSLSGIRIENAGNDAVDLMDSNVRISDAYFDRVGDKGVSAGEGSRVTISGATISNSAIGVAAKDRSVVTISDTVFSNNVVALDLYIKNLRYGGSGSAELSTVQWDGNDVDVRVADGGIVTIRNSPAPLRIIKDSGTVTIH